MEKSCVLLCGEKFYCQMQILSASVCLNPFPSDKILDFSKLKAFADDKIHVGQKLLWDEYKTFVGKGEKAFSPFPTMFSTALFFRVVKSRYFVVKI